jgi:hypothetical protein
MNDVTRSSTVPGSLMQATIAQFSDAWARCDIDKLMTLMSDAPLYRTSSGLTFEGREAVRQGFSRMCQPAKSPPPANSAPPPGKFVFFDDKCLSYWTLTLPAPDGQSRLVEGIDVISFDPDGRIRIKDAYRKGT